MSSRILLSTAENGSGSISQRNRNFKTVEVLLRCFLLL